ncbi:outer membrane protein assembly factor BamB family protein [Haladaptatus litoreus]|nr:PQQ-binding-like beta-propeller repeat protein [Haladaptatus litoreus]
MESPNYGDGLMGIYSLNGATGEIQWRRPDIDPAEIEVANDRVYFAGGALDATTGTSIWEIDGQDDLMGVTGDTLYTCRWDSTAQTTVITARDAATGTKLWSITRDFKTVKTVITSDTVYVTTTTSEQEPSFTVTALAATDGSLQWQSPVPVRGTSPTIEYSLDGTEKYTVDRDPYLSEPAVDSSRFYILTRAYEDDIIDGVKQPHGEYLDSYSTLYAFDRSTGDEVWRFETPAQALAAPTVTDNTVYFACKYHEAPDGDSISWGTPAIYALNAGTGAKQWVSAFNASSDSWITAPVVVDKRIFTTVQIIGNYPEIYALESTDCGESIPDEGAQTVRNDPDSKTNQMGRSESEITGSSASDGSAQLKANNPQGAQSVPPSQLSDHSLSIKAYDWQSPLAFIGGLGTSVGTYLSSHSPLRTDD